MKRCPSTLTIQPPDRDSYVFHCQAGLGHVGNHRHLAKSGVARVWVDGPGGGKLLEKIRLPHLGAS